MSETMSRSDILFEQEKIKLTEYTKWLREKGYLAEFIGVRTQTLAQLYLLETELDYKREIQK